MISFWRPEIPLSIDGEPLAVSTTDMWFTSFPYERLPTNANVLSFFLQPTTPLILIAAYIVSEMYVMPKLCQVLGINGRNSTFWKVVFAFHNLSLAIFSFVVWVNSWVSARIDSRS